MSDISFDFSQRDLWLMDQAALNGIAIPKIAMHVSRQYNFPFPITCVVLERESMGGNNVYGGDDTIWQGHHLRKVTQQNYAEYRVERDWHKKAQGVGPMQLTFIPLQDEADAMGGCWNPYVNVLTGVNFLDKKLRAYEADENNSREDAIFKTFVDWNSEAYANAVVNVALPKWRGILKNPH